MKKEKFIFPTEIMTKTVELPATRYKSQNGEQREREKVKIIHQNILTYTLAMTKLKNHFEMGKEMTTRKQENEKCTPQDSHYFSKS